MIISDELMRLNCILEENRVLVKNLMTRDNLAVPHDRC